MRSQVLILLLVTISACVFQSTHQYRLKKRELDVDFLLHGIVRECSARKVDRFIRKMCHTTFQDALEGKFPHLITFCKKKGSGTRYCDAINQHTRATLSVGAKRSLERRSVPSDNGDRRAQTTNDKLDPVERVAAQLCMRMSWKSSMNIHRPCNEIMQGIQRQCSQIENLRQYHPDYNYCQVALSSSSLVPWRTSEASAPRSHPSSVPLDIVESDRVEPVSEH